MGDQENAVKLSRSPDRKRRNSFVWRSTANAGAAVRAAENHHPRAITTNPSFSGEKVAGLAYPGNPLYGGDLA